MWHWLNFKRKLSAYGDHSLRAEEYRSVWSHLYHCPECREEVSGIEQLGLSLRRLPPPAVPERLLSDIRIRISEERARRQRPSWLWKLTNEWGHLALPGATGLFTALAFFAIFAFHFAVPLRSSPDVPLDLRTSAHLRDSRVLELGSGDNEMVVQLLIDPQGRVADYSILAGTYTPEDVRKLRNDLLFAIFEPAMVFGRPISEHLVIVNIRG
jgi:hypothetical protein